MKAMIMLAAALLGATGCSAVRGEEQETNFGENTPTAATDEAAFAGAQQIEESAATSTARPVVDQESAAAAINFVATELHSASPIDGTSLLGQGSVIVTFVQPGCEFSAEQSEVLGAAADTGNDVSYVFVHSGGSRESFLDFTDTADLGNENIVHLDDSAGDLTQRFGIDTFPATMLVGTDGALSSSVGVLDQDRLEIAIELITN